MPVTTILTGVDQQADQANPVEAPALAPQPIVAAKVRAQKIALSCNGKLVQQRNELASVCCDWVVLVKSLPQVPYLHVSHKSSVYFRHAAIVRKTLQSLLLKNHRNALTCYIAYFSL